jgi:hypothetical protein
MIENYIPIRTSFWERFAQLLENPFRCWVAGHVAVQNPAPPMLNHEKTVERLEGHSWHREKIEGGDHLAVILQEGQPSLAGVGSTPNASQISCHAALRNDKAEFLKLTVDFGSSPMLVFLRQTSD